MGTEEFNVQGYRLLSNSLEDWFQSSIDSIPLPKAEKSSLRPEDIDTVVEYLKNPTKAGVWTLRADWVTDAGISKYIWQELSQKLEKQRNIVTLKLVGKTTRLSLESLSDIKTDIFHRVSLFLNLFTHILANENKPPEEWEVEDTTYQTIFNGIDLVKVRENFSDAYLYFKENIYHQGFAPIIQNREPFSVKNGIIFTLDTAQIKERLLYYSLHPDSLRTLATFLSKLGKIADSRVVPIFSPEEEVLNPYFLFAQLAYSRIINDDRLHPLFTKSFTEYEEDRFESSISTLGLIGEDFLTQIYETLFREAVPKGQTMGQLYDLIQVKTAKLFQKEPPQPPDIDAMYKAVNEQINLVQSGTTPDTVDVLKLLRQAITLIKDERAYNRELAKDNQKQTSATSIFPARIRENINDLIRFRNAASHKSRVPLSDYEALRTLHCLISLVVWWHSEIRVVDWNDTPETIIKKMTERSVAANA
jgi:hypothetical protein